MELSLKPSDATDESFLWRLHQLAYQEVVTSQFGSWDPIDQRMRFEEKLKTLAFSIVVADGVAIGALASTRSDGVLTLMELLVLPAEQNKGIGTSIIRRLQEEASSQRVPVMLQVLHLNRARTLYERLGFRVYEVTETHYRMRWDHDIGS